MATDIGSLEKRYFNACKRQGILPNKSIVEAFFKAKIKKARHEVSSLVISLDDLKDVDFYPLLDLLKEIDISEIDAVDMINRSSCALNGEYVSSLLLAVNEKLRLVDIRDISFGKDFLLNLAWRGIPCKVLNLRSFHFRKLNMVGKFPQLHTLNLDFCASLISFQKDCFSNMPNLRLLSLCETRIANMWTTSAALANLPSLVELRFQNCLYDSDMGHSYESPENESLGGTGSGGTEFGLQADLLAPSEDISFDLNIVNDNITVPYVVNKNGNTYGDSSDDSEVDFSGHNGEFDLHDFHLGWNELSDLENEIYFGTVDFLDGDQFSRESVNVPKKQISRHASPICYKNHYRDYMIASLPNLKVLDNLPISELDREKAKLNFTRFFEYLPYNRQNKENIVNLLHNREIRTIPCSSALRKKFSLSSKQSQYYYSRSFSAAKMGSSAWPNFFPLSLVDSVSGGERRNFRPRQFEYHPTDSSLMVFGTLDGEVVVINHESERIVSYIPSLGAMNNILGLCWLKKYPSKLVAGSDNGCLKLYDIQQMSLTSRCNHQSHGSVNFDEFDQLTSVHVNSTDELFLASGYSKHVALYDISSGKRLQVFTYMHREHINVVKFSNHSPSIFATSSFDHDVKLWDLRTKPSHPCYTASSSRGNVMICFSPDDHYLLVSAVDNEVKQLLAGDGRLHLDFDIESTGSSQNYTRSYYMNGRDYIISGSCDENVVRVCCANTGRRLRDVTLKGKGAGASMYVQSLRGDPFRII